MKLTILGVLMVVFLTLPLAVGQEVSPPQEGRSCLLLDDEMVKTLDNQCLDPGNGGSAVCGSYNCFTRCETITVNDCVWRWVCASFAAACVYWTVDPRGRAVCAATAFVCTGYDWQQVCTPREEQRCQTYCVR